MRMENPDHSNYIDYINEKLDKIQDLIIKTKELQILYPEQKGLEIDLISLEHMEEELFNELENYYIEQNFSIFEIKLTGNQIVDSKIPISQLGDILKNTQEVISSISKFQVLKKKKRIVPVELIEYVQKSLDGDVLNEDVPDESKIKEESPQKNMLSEDLVKNTEFQFLGSLKGSIRVVLTTPYPALDNTALNNSLILFKDLVKCGTDRESIQSEVGKIGDLTPIIKYKRLLQSLYLNDIDISFYGKTKEFEYFKIIELDHKEAKGIYQVLNKKEKPIKHDDIKIGFFRKIDLDSREFKFIADDDLDTLISGKYEADLDTEMEEKNFHDPYKIKYKSYIPTDKLKHTRGVKYKLLEFLG